jgi:hypothetical protein
LPFPPANAPVGESSSFVLVDNSPDVLSGTVQAGTFYYHIDDNPFNSDPSSYTMATHPIVLEPAMYQTPIQIFDGASTGGTMNMNGIPGVTTPIAPITPTSKCEIRTGLVKTYEQLVSSGSGPFTTTELVSYSTPAALFFAQRDWIDNSIEVASNTRSAGTSRLSPVTALDCLYWSQVPTAVGSSYPNGIHYDKLIRFQCQFEYETAN